MRLGASEFVDGNGEDPEDIAAREPTEEERFRDFCPLHRPLLEFTMDEIMAELRMRFPSFIFLGEEPFRDDTGIATAYGNGDFTMRVGLAQRYLWRLQARNE